MIRSKHEIQEACLSPHIQTLVADVRTAEALKDELFPSRELSHADFAAYQLATKQWARAYNALEDALREVL
jgi:hypothetical protein